VKIKIRCFLITGFLTALLAGCVSGTGDSPNTNAMKPVSGHPALSEQEKLIACQDCHRDATPDVYEEWYESAHGMAQVKCYECHGTFEELKTVPDETSCAVCHDAQCKQKTTGKQCWECHPAHKFTVHK